MSELTHRCVVEFRARVARYRDAERRVSSEIWPAGEEIQDFVFAHLDSILRLMESADALNGPCGACAKVGGNGDPVGIAPGATA